MENTMPPPKMQQQLVKKDRRVTFSSSDDNATMKQIQATHSPDNYQVDVKSILHIVEDVLRHVTHSLHGVVNGVPAHLDTLEDKTSLNEPNDMFEGLANDLHKISCEISCKCSGGHGGDAHTTTALFNMLSSYSWDGKVALALAAFAANYGEFWIVAQLYPANPLAKSIALLKQFPDIIEYSNSLKSKFDAINGLIKAILDVTKCMVEFEDLPHQYISKDTPPLSVAIAHIPIAAYWTIRGIVACASQITSLIGMSHEFTSSAAEGWELSSLVHKIGSIHDHLRHQLAICHKHIGEKRDIDAYHMLVRLFESIHHDNQKILRALIYMKDDIQPLVDGSTKTRVNLEVLRRKNVLLLISDFDITQEEVMILDIMYKETKTRPELQYEMVWLPVVDRLTTTQKESQDQDRFKELQSMMEWYTVHDPSLLEPAVIRYIKEAWHFTKKLIIVVLDPLGRVSSTNALYMMWVWGNLAFPFTTLREESLWKAEIWRLELLVDGIDPTILEWIPQGKFICLYGGEDIEWIRNFTKTAKAVAEAAGIALEMVYVGKNNTKERVRNIMEIIKNEKLSLFWPDLTSIWFFWSRLESMLYSKAKHGSTVENDLILQEVMRMLSFDGSDQGWALICKGSNEMAKAKGETVLKSLSQFDSWAENAREIGFIPAFNDHLEKLHTPHHCNRLILPGINGGITELVVCAECGRPMEKFYMYRCCTD